MMFQVLLVDILGGIGALNDMVQGKSKLLGVLLTDIDWRDYHMVTWLPTVSDQFGYGTRSTI